jgi:hypothetical protein
MMYIIRQSDKDIAANAQRHTGRDYECRDYTWHVGDGRPVIKGVPFEDVCEVYADGHELADVRKNYKNLPDVSNECGGVVWRGDLAQFIYDHLPNFGSRAKVGETIHFQSES